MSQFHRCLVLAVDNLVGHRAARTLLQVEGPGDAGLAAGGRLQLFAPPIGITEKRLAAAVLGPILGSNYVDEALRPAEEPVEQPRDVFFGQQVKAPQRENAVVGGGIARQRSGLGEIESGDQGPLRPRQETNRGAGPRPMTVKDGRGGGSPKPLPSG